MSTKIEDAFALLDSHAIRPQSMIMHPHDWRDLVAYGLEEQGINPDKALAIANDKLEQLRNEREKEEDARFFQILADLQENPL